MAKSSQPSLHDDPQTQLPAILTVPEIADYLRVGEAVVYEAIRQGLPHFKMGRLIRIPRDQFLLWQDVEATKSAALPGSNGAATREGVRLGNVRPLSR